MCVCVYKKSEKNRLSGTIVVRRRGTSRQRFANSRRSFNNLVGERRFGKYVVGRVRNRTDASASVGRVRGGGRAKIIFIVIRNRARVHGTKTAAVTNRNVSVYRFAGTRFH